LILFLQLSRRVRKGAVRAHRLSFRLVFWLLDRPRRNPVYSNITSGAITYLTHKLFCVILFLDRRCEK